VNIRNSACRSVLSELISTLNDGRRKFPDGVHLDFLAGYDRVCNGLWRIRTKEMAGMNIPIVRETAVKHVKKRVRQFTKNDIGNLLRFPLLAQKYIDGVKSAIDIIERWQDEEST
jgi:hypothetical protein